MELTFRDLEAADVEARVANATESGCSLLLYKSARCDMRMLDEAVGAGNWQRRHERIGDTLFCSVGIRDEGAWVWKQDCGVPSSMEGEKGEASDAFKRACFNWGIGRELYTAPFIWVPSSICKIGKNRQGKPACFDRFSVASLEVDGGRIVGLVIQDETTGKVAFDLERPKAQPRPQAPTGEDGLLKAAKQRLWDACRAYGDAHGMDPRAVLAGVQKRPGYAETPEWLSMVAIELEGAASA